MVTHRWSTPQRPARVVVLGASGFVGSDLVRHVEALGIETVPLASAQVDFCSSEAATKLQQVIRRDDALVFAAALTPEKGKDVRTFMKNLAMGEQVSAVLQQSPCAHVLYISSDAVYGDGTHLIRETSCVNPTTFHGLMHLVRERMLAHALQISGSPLLVLRPCAL